MTKKPNILILIVDALRADYLGCYGNKKLKTPTVDRLAKEGIRFTQAIASATWTPASMSDIFTGIYPHKLGIYDFRLPFPSSAKTLFHYFKKADYTIGSFVFDEKELFTETPEANVIDNFRDFSKPLSWIKKHKNKPFFLFIHYYWCHGPYEPQSSAKAWSQGNKKLLKLLRENYKVGRKKCQNLYEKAVEKMDKEWLSQILKTLKDNTILDKTLIVFTADHGESWGERYKDKSQIKLNFDLHGRLLYDELLRVPLIMRYPPVIPAGRKVEKQVRHVDIAPTILDIISLKYPFLNEKIKKTDGLSLTNEIFGKSKKFKDQYVISSAPDLGLKSIAKISVRKPPWKLIWSIKKNKNELYNIKNDSNEKKNVITKYPKISSKLSKILESELEKTPKKRLTKKEQEKIKTSLRRLGYLE